MGLTFASFYNTSGTGSWEATDNSFARGFMATKKFTREELPAGSIIEIASGWQYRPEGWTYTGTRPGNVTTLRIVIDEDWWGSYTERAFNISQVAHTTDMGDKYIYILHPKMGKGLIGVASVSAVDIAIYSSKRLE